MAFPPQPVYPLALDSNRTLFLVYNTSETRTSSDNLPWSQEIEINPVDEDAEELWADNGYANIAGEMFYYDAVEKNSFGKVVKLKKCSRNRGGKKTQFNARNTWVRGYVVAEHHNQIVQAILNLEEFVGTENDDDKDTLTYKINNLNEEPTCVDDQECPEVILEFNIEEASSNSCEGTLASYNLIINGFFKNFKIDFGDGNSDTSSQSGTHLYAPNATIDPIVTVSNDTCTIIQTAIERDNVEEPQTSEDDEDFTITLPELNEFPEIVIPEIIVPDSNFTFPQLNMPCFEFESVGSISFPSIITVEPPIPSFIEFGPVNIPSIITFIDPPTLGPIEFETPVFPDIEFGVAPVFPDIEFGPVPSFMPIEFGPVPSFMPIEFGPVNIPSVIQLSQEVPSIITVVDNIPSVIQLSQEIPSIITVVDNIPSVIQLSQEIPSVITVYDEIPSVITVISDVPSIITVSSDIPSIITVDHDIPSVISVEWNGPTSISCIVTCGAPALRAQSSPISQTPTFFDDSFNSMMMETVESENLGIPTEIKLIVPEIPDIYLIHNLPSVIYFEVPHIPETITMIVPEIPTEIHILGADLIPTQIELISDLPTTIYVEGINIPTSIKLEMPEDLRVLLDTSNMPTQIQVVGLPDVIEIKSDIPNEIIVKPSPELQDLKIEMVYKGGPLPLQYESQTPVGEDGNDLPCFHLVPCGK